ncbi:GTPase [Desulforapulum autotrophicum HRM2]|uniref:GTPase n=1 Tax=Desulforapulum autotrophicum (strain ATCC 43914 / DSM 3382 / VKM B-1955 / HRM2) TaxID=177437 RepID=C0QEF6_DESAH|nr:[FeFe] hydrogenase H-cluster maturation GTPase HydF [Desulforapulum autotrophicum]ACN13273.1 GTPase [Desulforapulum autotrophicum HRM2]
MSTPPLAEMTRIVLAGVRNAGKSSLMNNLFQKDIAITSETPGTTTDPVTRKIELGKLGMCAITDTAGLDDAGALGEQRILKTRERLETADLILFVSPGDKAPTPAEKELKNWLLEKNLPWIGVISFKDLPRHEEKKTFFEQQEQIVLDNTIEKSCLPLIEKMEKLEKEIHREMTPVEGLVQEQDLVLLVTPIDLAAPAGRLILPQVETIRDLLDRDCAALIVKERELYTFYHNIGIKPALVITDSQVFHKVAADIPEDQPLTSFSILFARKKGDPSLFIRSLNALKNFPQKGRVLVMEVCSHHRQAEDLGTVKIPRLFRQLVGSQVEFGHTRKVPKDPDAWDMVIHCAGCMITQKAMDSRLEIFREKGIPVLNYGLFLAWANGLLPRALEPFPELAELFLENNPL